MLAGACAREPLLTKDALWLPLLLLLGWALDWHRQLSWSSRVVAE